MRYYPSGVDGSHEIDSDPEQSKTRMWTGNIFMLVDTGLRENLAYVFFGSLFSWLFRLAEIIATDSISRHIGKDPLHQEVGLLLYCICPGI